MNDSELVKECLNGKQEAQRQLYDFYAPKMLGVCYRYASSRDEAEDFLHHEQGNYQFISNYRNSTDKNSLTWNYHFNVNYKLIPRLELYSGIGIINFTEQFAVNNPFIIMTQQSPLVLYLLLLL